MTSNQKTFPVEVVRDNVTGTEEMDIKRFYVPGCRIISKCPNCGENGEMNLGQDHLSYPSLSAPTEVYFYCCSCESEWPGLVQVSVKIEAVAPDYMATEQSGGGK